MLTVGSKLLRVTSLFAAWSQLPSLDSSSFLTADPDHVYTLCNNLTEKYLLSPSLSPPLPSKPPSLFAFHTCAHRGLSDPSLNSHSHQTCKASSLDSGYKKCSRMDQGYESHLGAC